MEFVTQMRDRLRFWYSGDLFDQVFSVESLLLWLVKQKRFRLEIVNGVVNQGWIIKLAAAFEIYCASLV